MHNRTAARRKKLGSLKDRSLKSALAHRIHKEFPRIGGPRMRGLCAELVLDVLATHLRPREHLSHGQVLWLATNIDDPPLRNRRTIDTDLVPVVLDLSTAEDIEKRITATTRWEHIILEKTLRLCHQARQQGALLSNCDLAELLATNDSRIARILASYERSTGTVVPRRATVHDVGTATTHKRIICTKRFIEGKEPLQIARETYHSIEAVDRYLGQYDRVRLCKLQGLSPTETATALACSVSLVNDYLAIDHELEAPNA